MDRELILDSVAIDRKLDRMAWQILEKHSDAEEITLVGLRERGHLLALELYRRLNKISECKVSQHQLHLQGHYPGEVQLELSQKTPLLNKEIILVDDVLNSGITLALALNYLFEFKPKSVRIAVLANRAHHKFPVQAEFVGLSLATTLKEHISFEYNNGQMKVWLD